MDSTHIDQLIRNAERVYEESLRSRLESSHQDEFVAIEPISGDYYLGRTLSEAMSAARDAHPDRLAHVMRVGHTAALHFGANFS
jgi:hypothetical protein